MTALPVGGISDPVTTRFGVHLIQVVDRRQTTLDIRAAARAGAQHPARAEVRGGLHRMAARPARPRLHRVCASRRSERRRASLAARERSLAVQHAGSASGSTSSSTGRWSTGSSTRSIRSPGQALVEIGPGRGALTGPLLERCQALTVIELDRDLAARLRRTPGPRGDRGRRARRSTSPRSPAAGGGPQAARRRQPALQHLDADPVPPARREPTAIDDQHFMLQKEVVDADGRGARQQGLRPAHASCCSGATRSSRCSTCRPRRSSRRRGSTRRCVRMTPLPTRGDVDPALLRELVTVGFSQRRKLLRHTLGRWLDARGATQPLRSAAPRRGSPGRRVDRPGARAQKNDPGGVGPSLSEGGERSGEGAALDAACGSGAAATPLQPHRRVEGAAHQRHVRAEAAVRRRLGGRLDRLVAAVDAVLLRGPLPSPAPMTLILGSGLLKRIEAPERDLSLRPEVGRIAEDVEQLLARLAIEARVVGKLLEDDDEARLRARPCGRGRSCSRTAHRGSCRSAPGR